MKLVTLFEAEFTSLGAWLQAQREEAMGPVNKWFCSQHYGKEITDPETLMRYYIEHGGAAAFRRNHVLKVPEKRPMAAAV